MTRHPSALLAAVALLLAGGAIGVACSPRQERPALRDPSDSIRTANAAAHARDSARLHAWADSLVQARGDSLERILRRRASVRRPAMVVAGLLPAAPESAATEPEQHDEAVRTILVSDSSCAVRADSLERGWQGCDAERSFEAEEARIEAQQARASRWGWGAVGTAAGAVVGAVLVLIAR